MHKVRIVIVEDDAIIALEIKSTLEEYGYTVPAVVSSGKEAIKAAETFSPDIIIMDIILQGGMDGISAALKIRSKHDIPIIYLTANADPDAVRRARKTQPYAYVNKPIKDIDLFSNIEAALERHGIEKKLRESEEKYRRLFDLESDALFMIDCDTRDILEANSAACTIYGYSHDELTKMKNSDLSLEVEETKRAVDEKVNTIPVRWHRKKDGSPFPVEITATYFSWQGRQIHIAAIRDISFRKNIEDEKKYTELALKESYELRRKSEDKFFMAFHLSRVLMAISEVDTGAFIEINKCFEEATGYSRDEAIGKNYIDLGMIPDNDVLTEIFSLLEQKGSLHDYEIRFHNKTGKLMIGLLSADYIEFDNNRKYMLTSIFDITEQRKVEKFLKESKSRYRTLIKTTETGFVVIDKIGRVIDANNVYVRLTGHSELYEILGRNVVEWTALHDKKRNSEEIAKCWEKGFVKNLEIDYIGPGGLIVPVEMNATLDSTKEGWQILALCRDITERKKDMAEKKKLEEQLYQAQKMESIGRLAGGIAHDFNNMLTAIIGNVSLALMAIKSDNNQRDLMIEVMDAAESAASLTRQLLAFSRKQIIEPRVLDLNDLLLNMNRMLVRLIGEDIILRTLPCKNLGMVKVDPTQIEQIIINLAVNARDAMPNGGELVLETADIYLDEDYCREHVNIRPGNYVMLAFSDSGQGMSDEVKRHLFEPFFTTKPQGKGTGLGLATIYGAVSQNNGSIFVYSELGKGTTFKIYFPRFAGESEPIEVKIISNEIPGGKETILLVEDEPIVRDYANKLLKKLGYNVYSCSSGPEALMVINEQKCKFHLLMTDVVMPGMNGRELAEKVKVECKGIKVIFTSGYTEDVVVHHGVLEEGLNFIGKPYTPQMLAQKIRKALDEPPPSHVSVSQ